MAFWNKVKDVTNKVGEAASDTIETTKLKAKIREAEKNKEELFIKLGQFVFERSKEVGDAMPEAAKELVAAITNHNEVIEQLKKDIESIKLDDGNFSRKTEAAAEKAKEAYEDVAEKAKAFGDKVEDKFEEVKDEVEEKLNLDK